MILPSPKLFLLFVFTINCFLGCALFFGWASILKVYRNEGIYSELCLDSNATALNQTTFVNGTYLSCTEQDNRFNIIYSVSSGLYFAGYLLFGIILDLTGPKTTAILSNFTIVLGGIFLILYKQFDSLIPGWILMSIGGSGLTSCSLHIAMLFSSARAFVLALVPTSLLVSGFTLTVFQLLTTVNVPLYVLFIVYTSVHVFFLFFALFFQPFKMFTPGDIHEEWNPIKRWILNKKETPIEDPASTEEIKEDKAQMDAPPLGQEMINVENPSMDQIVSPEPKSDALIVKSPSTPVDPTRPYYNLPLWRQVLTIEFFMTAFFLSTLSLCYTWYAGTLFSQYSLMGDNNHDFATAFNFSLLSVFLFFPWFGPIVKFLGVIVSMFIAWVVGVLLLTLISIPYLYVQPIGYVLFAFGRPFTLGVCLTFFAEFYGFKNIGTMFGLISLWIGIISFLQIPFKLLVAAVGQKFWVMNLILIGFAMLTVITPLYFFAKRLWMGKWCPNPTRRESQSQK